MSKYKMPEAGEVWLWGKIKIFITCVLGDEELGAISFMDNIDRHHCTDSFDTFAQKIRAGVMTYLGKSKCNIDQLFEVEECGSGRMWKWQLKQNNLIVARGSGDDKKTCLTEAFRYTDQYSEEDFKNMTLIIKEQIDE